MFFQFAFGQRPRAYKGHLPTYHIDQLRQFIDRITPAKSREIARYTWVAQAFVLDSGFICDVLDQPATSRDGRLSMPHRAKFQGPQWSSEFTGSQMGN